MAKRKPTEAHGAVLALEAFVCPLCRGPLDRVGGCLRCYGCTTGRKEDWTFPGAYEDLPAGRSSCTPRENVAAMQIVQAVLAKKMTVTEAEDHLATIFQGRERLDARLALTP